MIINTSDLKIISHDKIQDSVKDFVINGLRSYNDGFSIRNQHDFSITAEYNNEIVAAAVGESKYNWLIIQYFYVNERFRNIKVGSMLIKAVVDLAKNRKCTGIHLDTFEFQARDFYIKQGFVVFGEINDHPSGYKRYFMKMSIT